MTEAAIHTDYLRARVRALLCDEHNLATILETAIYTDYLRATDAERETAMELSNLRERFRSVCRRLDRMEDAAEERSGGNE